MEDIVFQVQPASSHANSSLPFEWLITVMDDTAESSSTGENQPKMPKIPKVPKMFRDIRSFRDDCFDPLVVSIGPYHYGKSELQEMVKLKINMAKQYVRGIREISIPAVYEKFAEVAGEAKKYYDFEPSSAIDDESFTKMMFLDGCFLLQYIYSSVYGSQDMGMKIHHAALVKRDLFLLENQLPYIVLEALMSTRFDHREGKTMIEEFINLNLVRPPPQKLRRDSLRDFTKSIYPTDKKPTNNSSSTKSNEREPLHLLDMMRKKLAGPEADKALSRGAKPQGSDQNWYQRYQSAKELKTVGISCRASKSCYYSDVRFSSTGLFYGKLTLPPLIIDDTTKSMLLNMLAFETQDGSDDFSWVTSYICFVRSLIKNQEDVSILRSQNVLVINNPSMDYEVADLFNDMAKYLAPDPRAYVDVKNGIKAHYSNKFKKWMGSPWTFFGLVGFYLSVIQTFAALYPIFQDSTKKKYNNMHISYMLIYFLYIYMDLDRFLIC